MSPTVFPFHSLIYGLELLGSSDWRVLIALSQPSSDNLFLIIIIIIIIKHEQFSQTNLKSINSLAFIISLFHSHFASIYTISLFMLPFSLFSLYYLFLIWSTYKIEAYIKDPILWYSPIIRKTGRDDETSQNEFYTVRLWSKAPNKLHLRNSNKMLLYKSHVIVQKFNTSHIIWSHTEIRHRWLKF